MVVDMSSITVPPRGPVPATVLVIGEFPTVDDERKMRLFSGMAGEEFHKMLHEAGFLSTEIRFTTLLRSRPYNSQMKYAWTKTKKEANACMPGVEKTGDIYCSDEFKEGAYEALREIERVQPNVVITLGDAALWAITGELSISKWRGSLLKVIGTSTKVIPTYSPQQIMKMWEWRYFAVRDLQRAKHESGFKELVSPEMRLTIRPDFDAAMDILSAIIDVARVSRVPMPIVSDIETISRHIACIGFAWSRKDAVCIPLMNERQTHFYPADEEAALVWKMREVLTHPNIEVVGQNWSYDTQHIVRSWGFRPKLGFDTMLAQHVCFPGVDKNLGFLASMYCEHYVYWKDELTDYRTLPKDLDKFWLYNAKDCVNTFEIYEVLKKLVTTLGFDSQLAFIHRLNHHVITMMIRGVNIDREEKSRLASMLMFELDLRQCEINYLLGEELNISSPKQMKELFYDQLKMKVVPHKKTHEPTTDKNALQVFGTREPILKPLTDLIEETRSIGVFLSTFVQMPLDNDKRMRCSYNAGGTETFRFSSSKNALDRKSTRLNSSHGY